MKKRNVMMLVVLLVIGFASVSTSLILNGTIGIGTSEDDLNVIFTEATINGAGATATIDETKKKIIFTSSKLTTVGEKAILDYKIKNNSTQYDADVTINCTNDASEFIKVANTLANEEITKDYKTTFTAQEEKSGNITAELIKSSIEESESISVTCTIVANATERTSAVEPFVSPWKITEDKDNNGELSNGDLITIGTESFYVYDIVGDKIKAIAQYNLYAGSQIDNSWWMASDLVNQTGLQNSLARGLILDEKGSNAFPFIGVVPFTTTEKYNASKEVDGVTLEENDYSISVLKEYVDEYANKLKDLGAKADIVRVITKDELEKAGCNQEKYSCKAGYSFDSNSFIGKTEDATFIGAPEYLYSTSYWIYSPSDDSETKVMRVLSNGYYGSLLYYEYLTDNRYHGVRPVIEVSKSLFE